MKKLLIITLIVIFAAAFLFSAIYLADHRKNSNENSRLYEDLAYQVDQARQTIPVESNPHNASTTEPTSMYTTVTDPETGKEVELLPEYAQVYLQNNDLVGWIRIDGTSIDYPVLQTPDQKDYYLTRNFDRTESSYGAIYVQENCDVFAPSDNLVIYGHRMNDGSMFADLHEYKEQSFYEAHPYITFDTLKQRQTYQILSVFLISSVEDHPFQYHLFVNAQSQLDFDEFILNCNTYALYDTGVTASYGDKLITLSTCEYSNLNGRLVVVAKLID